MNNKDIRPLVLIKHYNAGGAHSSVIYGKEQTYKVIDISEDKAKKQDFRPYELGQIGNSRRNKQIAKQQELFWLKLSKVK